MTLEEKYPFIASWVVDGQIQIGQLDSYEPMAAVLDLGGTIWDTNEAFDSLDSLFDAMEKAIGLWCKQNGVEVEDHEGNAIPWPKDD